MGVFSDVTQEFKGAGKGEKALIIVGVIGVAGVAYYLYTHQSSQQGITGGASSSGGSQVAGYPTAGGLPVLPPGVGPVFDPNGNPIAFQNPGPTTTPPTTGGGTPPPSTLPNNWFTAFLGKIGYGTQIRPGGVDTNGQRFWVGSGNSSFFYAPVGSTIQYGGQGRVWLTPSGGTQQLLTGPGQTIPNLGAPTTVAKVASK